MRSNRRNSALLRSNFTGENIVAARAGTARDGSPGLDHCTGLQRRLRALIALGLFNDHDRSYGDNTWCCPAVTSYNVTFSPRFDSLVIIADCPVNVAGRMVSGTSGLRVPGLRYNSDKECSGSLVHVIDVVSGAEMVVTDRVTGRVKPGDPKRTSPRFDRYFEDGERYLALTDAEQDALAQIPEMTPAIETLLAAIAVRLDARDPDRTWAMGFWFWDPLQREGHDAFGHRYGYQRVLQGSYDRWELKWSEHPYVEDVAAMLAHPVIGVSGCWVNEVGEGYDIHLNGSVLALRSWFPVGSQGCNLRPKNAAAAVLVD